MNLLYIYPSVGTETTSYSLPLNSLDNGTAPWRRCDQRAGANNLDNFSNISCHKKELILMEMNGDQVSSWIWQRHGRWVVVFTCMHSKFKVFFRVIQSSSVKEVTLQSL